MNRAVAAEKTDAGGNSAKRGGAVTLAAQIVHVVMGVGVGVLLARLLLPEDFGLFAIAWVPFGVVATLREFGLSASIVRAADVSHRELGGLFWLGMRYGALLAGALLLLTPPLAWFYGEPWLWGALPVLAGGLFLQSVGVVPLGLLRRRMRFGTVVAAELLAYCGAGAAAVALAWGGAGAWALVLQIIFQQVGVAALVLLFAVALAGWRIAGPRSSAPAGELGDFVKFGWQATASRVVLNFGRLFDFFALGRVAGPAALGFYERAFTWANFPNRQVQTPLVYVAVSGLSEGHRRLERADASGDAAWAKRALADYRRAAGLGLGLLLAVVFPAQMLLIVEAPAVVRVLLGEKWLPAAPLLMILSASFVFQTIGRSVKWIYLAEGRAGQQLRWSFFETAVVVAGVLCGLPFGAAGVAWAVLATSALVGPGAIAYCLRGSRLDGRAVLLAAARPGAAAGVAGIVIVATGRLLPLEASTLTLVGALARCLVQGVIFTAVYAALLLATRGGRDMLAAVLPDGVLRRLPLARRLAAQ